MPKYLDRDWLTLDAAAQRLSAEGLTVKPDDVLHIAAKGTLRGYARLRGAISIHARRIKADPNGIPTITVSGRGGIDAFVRLSVQELWRLDASGVVEVYSIKQRGDDPLEPFDEEPEPGVSWVPDEPLIVQASEIVVVTKDVDTLINSMISVPLSNKTVIEGREQAAWPWGSHETNLLVHLREAGYRWWALYDPADQSTAATNETVTEFLVKRGVSRRIAEAMATILRADGLRSGRR